MFSENQKCRRSVYGSPACIQLSRLDRCGVPAKSFHGEGRFDGIRVTCAAGVAVLKKSSRAAAIVISYEFNQNRGPEIAFVRYVLFFAVKSSFHSITSAV